MSGKSAAMERYATDRVPTRFRRIRPAGPLPVATAVRLVANGQHGATGMRHDLVGRRNRQMSCRARHTLLPPHTQNDEVGFSLIGEFQNLLRGIATFYKILSFAPGSGFRG